MLHYRYQNALLFWYCYFSLLTTQYFNPQEPALPNHNLLSMNLTAEPIIVV